MRTRFFCTSVTTALGFLSLNAAESPPFHDLGNYVALGVLWAFTYSMTLLPALLSVLPLRASVRSDATGGFDGLADFVVARRAVLLWSAAAAAVVLATGVLHIELTDNPTQYFDERYEFRRHSDYVAENLTSLDRLEYSLDAGREGGITDPDYLPHGRCVRRVVPRAARGHACPSVLGHHKAPQPEPARR